MLRIGFFQFRPLFGQISKNLSRVIKTLGTAEADLIVLPELAFTGYHFQNRSECAALAEDPARSATVASLHQLCKSRSFYIVTGFAERQGDRLFNSALLIGPEGLIHTYRKVHLFNEEKHAFDPGDIPLTVQRVRGTKIGMMVCFDWIFPETARTLAVQGAQILCHPSNLVLHLCQTAMVTRCIENRVFAVTANRFGVDRRPHGELKFTGKSQIVAPDGTILYRAAAQRNDLAIVDIDPAKALNKHVTPLNDIMSDRRPDYYRSLL